MNTQNVKQEEVVDDPAHRDADPLLMMTVALGFALACMVAIMMFS